MTLADSFQAALAVIGSRVAHHNHNHQHTPHPGHEVTSIIRNICFSQFFIDRSFINFPIAYMKQV
jgi:hypothetical protein